MFGAYVDVAVDDDGDVEAEGLAGSVALVVVFAVVKFVVDVGGVPGGEFGLGVGAVPGFGAENPEDATSLSPLAEMVGVVQRPVTLSPLVAVRVSLLLAKPKVWMASSSPPQLRT